MLDRHICYDIIENYNYPGINIFDTINFTNYCKVLSYSLPVNKGFDIQKKHSK